MPKIMGWWVVVAYKILVSATHSPFGPIRNYWDLSGVVAQKILETAKVQVLYLDSDFRLRLVNNNFISWKQGGCFCRLKLKKTSQWYKLV